MPVEILVPESCMFQNHYWFGSTEKHDTDQPWGGGGGGLGGVGACMSVVYRCVNKKNNEKGYCFRAGQCAALSSFRVGKMLFL